MKRILIFLAVVVFCSGISCAGLDKIEGFTLEQDGETIAGRDCVKRPEGGKCCTTTVPIDGKVTSTTACYGPDGKEEPKTE